jgi:GNAT superfamily N-acetyltransferase
VAWGCPISLVRPLDAAPHAQQVARRVEGVEDFRASHRAAADRENGGVETAFDTRAASLADLDALLAHLQAGFDSYVEFAPAGWRPRSVEQDREWIAGLLTDENTWALLALVEREPVGHVAFFPAREHQPDDRRHWSERPLIPGLAHLWQLFVLPDWWGRGVAPLLHDAAVIEMGARGYEQARLYTPAAHARARRFYERRRWSAQGEAWNQDLALRLTEYRLMPVTRDRTRA